MVFLSRCSFELSTSACDKKKVIVLKDNLSKHFLIDITLINNKVATVKIVRKYLVFVVNHAISRKPHLD